MIRVAQEAGTAAIIEEMLPKLLSPVTLKEKPAVFSHARRMMAGTPVNGVIGAIKGVAHRIDSSPTLASITVPTLITVGEDDSITPPTDAEAMYRAISVGRQTPNVALAPIEDTGHLAPMENPRDFNENLRGFLASLGD